MQTQRVETDTDQFAPRALTQVRNWGYTGELNGDLDGKRYCAVYADGSAAYGRLRLEDGKPCPTGSWLASGWQAHGFYRKPDSPKIALKVVGVSDDITNSHRVTWFMPVMDDAEAGFVWNEFLAVVDKYDLRRHIDTVSGCEPFGGSVARLKLAIDNHPESLQVVGILLDGKKCGYQLDRDTLIPGRDGRPLAVVHGWNEHQDNCRVMFRAGRDSFDTMFSAV